MKDIFNYNGTIGRKQYFIKQGLLLLVFIFIYIVYVGFLSLIPNDVNETTGLNVVLIGSLVFIGVIAIMYIIASLFLAMKRARDTGSFVLWITLAILLPFGSIIVCLIPPAPANNPTDNSLGPNTVTDSSAPPQPK